MADKWLGWTIEALSRLGGEGHVSDIFKEIENIAGNELSDLESPESPMRRTLQNYSSDAKNFLNKGDFFTSVHGVGQRKGIWALRNIDSDDNIIVIVEDDEEEFFYEGKEIARIHRTRERSRSLRNRKIDEHRSKFNLRCPCEVCGEDYSEIFGFDRPLIDAHHLIPISKISGNRKTDTDVLAMVCPTCHRALHMSEDCSDLDSLRIKIINYRERHSNSSNVQ
jgi:predicted HNH restriction endonuclease|tara:strand:- start:173 stop:841 length:669 start_codon:yes stop_codon:yes gene_type:complete